MGLIISNTINSIYPREGETRQSLTAEK